MSQNASSSSVDRGDSGDDRRQIMGTRREFYSLMRCMKFSDQENSGGKGGGGRMFVRSSRSDFFKAAAVNAMEAALGPWRK